MNYKEKDPLTPISPSAERSCIHELVERQAARTPDATAVIHAGKNLSYLRLNSRANQLARSLSQLGVKPGASVGIALRPSLNLPVALLAGREVVIVSSGVRAG